MDLIYNLFTILLGLLLILYGYFKYAYTYFEKRHIPFIEPTFPFGNFQSLAFRTKSFADAMKGLYDQMPNYPAFGVYLMAQPTVMLRDPEIVKQCLVKEFTSFHDRGPPINEEITPLFGHLFFLAGTKWKNLRAKLSPTFTSGKMKIMFSTIASRTQNFVDYLQANDTTNIDVEDSWTKLTTDIIASCAFGIECDSLKYPDNEFRVMGIRSTHSPVRLTLGMMLINGGKYLSKLVRWTLIDSDISDYFINMVKDTIEFREKNNIKKKDFMQSLIDLKNNRKIEYDGEEEDKDAFFDHDDGKSLTEVQCAAQAFVFFIGGFGTSSSTLTFGVLELAMNPDIQKRLQNEIDEVTQEFDGINYESINKMTYLDQVIKGI